MRELLTTLYVALFQYPRLAKAKALQTTHRTSYELTVQITFYWLSYIFIKKLNQSVIQDPVKYLKWNFLQKYLRKNALC